MATLNSGFDEDAWTNYAQDLYTQMQFFEEIDTPPPDENSWHDRANELMSQMKFFEEIDSWIHSENMILRILESLVDNQFKNGGMLVKRHTDRHCMNLYKRNNYH